MSARHPRSPWSKASLGAACSALALLLTTACTADRGDAPISASSTSTPAATKDLDQLRGAPTTRKRLFEAQEHAIAACMARRGWHYQPVSWHPADGDATAARGLARGDDIPLHRRFGYGVTTVRTSQPTDPNAAYTASLSRRRQERYSAALFGTPAHRLDARLPSGEVTFVYTDGCTAQAEKRLYGDLKKWLIANTTVVNLPAEVDNRVRAARELTATVKPWSGCMSSHGFRFSSPDEARNRIARAASRQQTMSRTRVERLHHREVSQAVVDATCDRAVGRSRVARSLIGREGRRIMDDRAPEISTYRALVRQALATLTGREKGTLSTGS
ncbi:hypothetical protein [Streptomyces sp. NPDC019937]|uniref:hypothetical protein n=1 Tax=Streptomyces sp. NPDC019937 TaxID=3154787 RepID=UPI0033DEB4A7